MCLWSYTELRVGREFWVIKSICIMSCHGWTVNLTNLTRNVVRWVIFLDTSNHRMGNLMGWRMVPDILRFHRNQRLPWNLLTSTFKNCLFFTITKPSNNLSNSVFVVCFVFQCFLSSLCTTLFQFQNLRFTMPFSFSPSFISGMCLEQSSSSFNV